MHSPSEDARYMREALVQAQIGARQGEVPVGAVVVRHGEIVARAHNAPIAQHDPTAHAEVQALRQAAQVLGNYRLEDCTLYVTLEPCAMCSGAILNARLPRLVFGAAEPRTGAAGSVLNVFESRLNAHTQVTAGLLADEAAALMQSFFSVRRSEQQAHRSPLKDDALRIEDAALQSPWSQFAQDWPQLNGWRLHWLDNRSAHAASQPATLYLHGPEFWSRAYEAQLQTDAPVLALDWLGFGLSDKPKKEAAYSADLHARVLLALMQHQNVAQVCAPESVQPIWQAVQALYDGARPLPSISWITAPEMSAGLARAPYPDRGHEAARRAWRTM